MDWYAVPDIALNVNWVVFREKIAKNTTNVTEKNIISTFIKSYNPFIKPWSITLVFITIGL